MQTTLTTSNVYKEIILTFKFVSHFSSGDVQVAVFRRVGLQLMGTKGRVPETNVYDPLTVWAVHGDERSGACSHKTQSFNKVNCLKLINLRFSSVSSAR